MDEAVIKYYRNLSRNGFKYAGSFENPSIYLKDENGEKIRGCSSVGSYVRLYLMVKDNVFTGVKYLCTCNPTIHVAIEILCTLIEGKTLDYPASLRVDSFLRILGGKSEELLPVAKSMIDLLNSGIKQYRLEHP